MSTSCLFCDIVAGQVPCHKVWEDTKHLAFLTIFPNIQGFTVVVPKAHYDSYIFEVPDAVMYELMLATKQVAKILDARIPNVGRSGVMFEGYGVNHLHSKLFPMIGTGNMATWQPLQSSMDKVFEQYEGYLSSHNGPRANDAELAKLAKQLRGEK